MLIFLEAFSDPRSWFGRLSLFAGRGVGEGMVTTMSFPDFAGKSVKSDAPHAYYMCLDSKKSGQKMGLIRVIKCY